MSKKRPFGITIMSVIGFISAFISILFGGAIIIWGGVTAGSSIGTIISPILGTFVSAFGIIMLIGGLIEGAISFGLWKMQKWAWYVAIGTYALSAIYALTQMNFVSLVIGGLMVYYLYSVRKKF